MWDCEGRVKGASWLVLEQDLELVARAMEGAMEMKKKSSSTHNCKLWCSSTQFV